MPYLIVFFQAVLMTIIASSLQGPTTASYHNYLTGVGARVLNDTSSTLEMIDGSRFMSDPKGKLTIVVTYGELPAKTLGIAMRGLSTCKIVISHVMNPETSVGYDEEDLRSVLIHEIGHCFGMDHFKKEDHVMFWAYDGNKPHSYEQISEFVNDLKRFRRAD